MNNTVLDVPKKRKKTWLKAAQNNSLVIIIFWEHLLNEPGKMSHIPTYVTWFQARNFASPCLELPRRDTSMSGSHTGSSYSLTASMWCNVSTLILTYFTHQHGKHPFGDVLPSTPMNIFSHLISDSVSTNSWGKKKQKTLWIISQTLDALHQAWCDAGSVYVLSAAACCRWEHC